MQITLRIDNLDALPNGGPVSFTSKDKGFDIGRNDHLDWCLPDPQRLVSGKHCEIRFAQGQFVLHDISTNGTHVNGSPRRLEKPHVLRHGDRLLIGNYHIQVTVGDFASSQPAQPIFPPQREPGGGAGYSGSRPLDGPRWLAPDISPGFTTDMPPHSPPPWPLASGSNGSRHAPPSLRPGVGTPPDDVWNQQTHGWGTSDPEVYGAPAARRFDGAGPPLQADPIDDLVDQLPLRLTPSPFSTSADDMPGPVSATSPFPESPFRDGDGLGPLAPVGTPIFCTPDFPCYELSKPANVAAEHRAPTPVAAVDAAATTSHAKRRAPPQPVSTDHATGSAQLAQGQAIMKAFARGAQISESVIADKNPEALAEQIGQMLHIVTADLMALLQARSQIKAATRNANLTLIGRRGNNALKFSPSASSALQIMLSDAVADSGYLPIEKAVPAAFKDIQKHHVWTYAAMQQAVGRLEAKLSPQAIKADTPAGKRLFTNPKAQLWERMEDRWKHLSPSDTGGLVGLFTQYFTECYEELSINDPDASRRGD